ncbi:MAG TPA: ribonuclease J [Candidatus Jorgensenbacteria bacterium]|nr:ribonuclease J [Candidatus Jorgensenbacteria bacterium]
MSDRTSTNRSHAKRVTHTTTKRRTAVSKPQPKKEAPTGDMVRLVPLGGLEEIGRNMMFLEYKDEIIIIDIGIQFPEEHTPGIDFIIPNVSYLELKKRNIKAILITHGHYDHIGAIPYLMEKLGNPPIYAPELTKEIIKKRQAEFPNSPKPIFNIVKPGDECKLSEYFSVKFFEVEHNIPDSVGLLIDTPIGKVVNPGDFKMNYDKHGNLRHTEVWERLGKEDIHTFMLDSTNAAVEGRSVSEEVVEEELTKIFKRAKGRVIVGTFASLLDRIAEIIKIAEKLGRVVAISGYSMKSNVEIAKRLGVIKTKKGTLIPLEDIKKYDDNKLLIMCTGAQGEKNASLMRIALGDHRHITLREGDEVVFSSSVIPGNERSVQTLKDNISRQGAIIYDYKMLDIHSSGHPPQDDIKAALKFVKPRYFVPIHGYYFMRWQSAQLAQEVIGMKPEHTILADNGSVIEMRKDSITLTKEKIPSSYVFVDGLGVGDVGEVVLRDRRALSEEGMVVIIAVLSKHNGRILKNPDIISRGFIYLRDNKELLNEIRKRIRGIVGRIPNRQSLDVDYVKTIIRDQIGEFLFRKTRRRPMILPVIIEV